ncbi:hypothetical protein [Peribacillus sp. SCS-37]|uniref:hypothetical protein n=1 Tax=Paraperibacillus esterisolvens TaxID=3115296 RepID=UPI00390622B7
MKMLTQEEFQKAETYIQESARKLDSRMFEFYFKGGTVEAAVDELLNYQNSDGGFGRSIEPDFRLEQSSPMATTIGLQYAGELGLGSEHVIIQKAVAYLLETYDHEQNRWHGVPEAVNKVPHAPWWNYDTEKGRSGAQSSWANPNAEITGYIRKYSELVPKSFVKTLTELALEELKSLPDKMEMHDLLCYLRLLGTFEGQEREAVLDKLKKAAQEKVAVTEDEWKGYGLKPIQVADSPEAELAGLFQDDIQACLDFEISRMDPEGFWGPNWTWFGQYEEDWKTAEADWKGSLTVSTLKVLREFGRIEGRQ